MERTATFLKRLRDHPYVIQDLFVLDPPLVTEWFGERIVAKHVVVSAVNYKFVHETYIFKANKDGKIIHWGELEGSFKGDMDITRALTNAGYTVLDDGR